MKKNILVVDDSALMRRVICDIINSDSNFQAKDTCKDGLEAYDLIIASKPDVVLLDVIMPHLDGIGVLEKLNEYGFMPICIMLSAVGQDKITQRALNLGAGYYMVKPFEVDYLTNL